MKFSYICGNITLSLLTLNKNKLKLITMKHLKKLLIILLAVVSFNNLNAQDEDNRFIIDIGTNMVDFYPTGAYFNPTGPVPTPLDGQSSDGNYLGGFLEEYYNFSDHYNFGTVVSRLHFGYYIGSGFAVGIDGSFNNIERIGNYETNSNVSYIASDVNVRYNFIRRGRGAWGEGNGEWFDPYVEIGGGYVWLSSDPNTTVNGAVGINFWFSRYVGATMQAKYKHSFDEDLLLPHFQHSFGLIFKFGGVDTDGDGIYDKNDACPEVFGLAEFNGCPDSDGDGIQDSEDACPNEAGLPEFNGCPDTDGDGIPDKNDACPNEAGPASTNGCPDRDGDGVPDKDDACPDQAGPAENKGCPWPDADGDGVLDKDDKCPNIVGPAENYGCPIVTPEVEKQITDLARAIYFNTGKATFTDETSIRMEQISVIVNQYKSLQFTVEGHTDNTGSKKINDALSQKRAEAVMNYLVEKGFPTDKISAKGFGSAHPIGDNKTRQGRQENRRVEVYSEFAKR